jgi:hypothetical protein
MSTWYSVCSVSGQNPIKLKSFSAATMTVYCISVKSNNMSLLPDIAGTSKDLANTVTMTKFLCHRRNQISEPFIRHERNA